MWVEEVTRGLLRAWRRVSPKPARPVRVQVQEVPEDVVAVPLGKATPIEGRLKRFTGHIDFSPEILAARVQPWRKLRAPGELRMWVPSRVALRGRGNEVPPLVIDPSPQPPEERWVWQVKEDAVKPRQRGARHWSQGGYRWPRYNEPAMEKPRRQLLLRTDLARLTYPKLPSPGRLMRPMLVVDDPVEPWQPMREQLPIELSPEELTWWRFMDHRVGAPEVPRPRWRSAVAQGAEERPAEPSQGSAEAEGEAGRSGSR